MGGRQLPVAAAPALVPRAHVAPIMPVADLDDDDDDLGDDDDDDYVVCKCGMAHIC
jgi:hypothetical protein